MEEKTGEKEGDFKVIIWYNKPQKVGGLKQLMIVAYFYICKFKKYYNARYIQVYQISEKKIMELLGCFRNRYQDFPGYSITF